MFKLHEHLSPFLLLMDRQLRCLVTCNHNHVGFFVFHFLFFHFTFHIMSYELRLYKVMRCIHYCADQSGHPLHLFLLMDQFELWPIVCLMWLVYIILFTFHMNSTVTDIYVRSWVTDQGTYDGGMLQVDNLPLSTLTGKAFGESNSHRWFLVIVAVDVLLYCLMTIHFLCLI